MSTAPASCPGPTSTCGPSVGKVRRWTLLDLYEQCSDHMAAYIASSVRLGSRPSVTRIRSSSSSVRPRARWSGRSTFTSHPGERVREERGEEGLPPRGSDVGIDGVLRVRHEPGDVPLRAPHPCNR